MKAVKITAALVQRGNIQLVGGRTVKLPDAFADELVEAGEAVAVPQAEYAKLLDRQTATMPRTPERPKPQPPSKLIRIPRGKIAGR